VTYMGVTLAFCADHADHADRNTPVVRTVRGPSQCRRHSMTGRGTCNKGGGGQLKSGGVERPTAVVETCFATE
jgi:hypothetical protein